MTAPTILTLPALLAAIAAEPTVYPPELLEPRREAFERQIQAANECDGSDTTLAGQLDEAGYGSFGPM